RFCNRTGVTSRNARHECGSSARKEVRARLWQRPLPPSPLGCTSHLRADGPAWKGRWLHLRGTALGLLRRSLLKDQTPDVSTGAIHHLHSRVAAGALFPAPISYPPAAAIRAAALVPRRSPGLKRRLD